MQGLESVGSAQRFLSVHAATYSTFSVERHLSSARTHRAFRALAMNGRRGRLKIGETQVSLVLHSIT
jgi:hypothetical protein